MWAGGRQGPCGQMQAEGRGQCGQVQPGAGGWVVADAA